MPVSGLSLLLRSHPHSATGDLDQDLTSHPPPQSPADRRALTPFNPRALSSPGRMSSVRVIVSSSRCLRRQSENRM